MKILIASDHAGFELKKALFQFLKEKKYDVIDLGPDKLDPDDDYPDFVIPIAKAVAADPLSRGIIIGGSGQGEAICANRFSGARAVVWYGGNEEIIRLSREHNDSNILSFGARFVSFDEARQVVEKWLNTAFSGDERHVRRLAKIETEKN